MPTIIYTDNVVGENGLPLNTTPAATYATTELATILDRIADGSIPCNTGQPYPVNWKTSPEQNTPWDTGGPSSSNPWKQY